MIDDKTDGKASMPKRFWVNDWKTDKFTKQVEAYIEFMWSPDDNPDRDRIEESDFAEYIFEAAVEMAYGKEIWNKIRERQK